jgi:hypothetical protein
MIERGNRSTRRKPAPVLLCPPQTPHACPDANPSRRSGKPATNRLSYGTALQIGGIIIVRGNRSTRRKPAPVPLCPPQTPHASPDANPGRRGGKPATNRLSYGTASHEQISPCGMSLCETDVASAENGHLEKFRRQFVSPSPGTTVTWRSLGDSSCRHHQGLMRNERKEWPVYVCLAEPSLHGQEQAAGRSDGHPFRN